MWGRSYPRQPSSAWRASSSQQWTRCDYHVYSCNCCEMSKRCRYAWESAQYFVQVSLACPCHQCSQHPGAVSSVARAHGH
jgi:hypothetical protein